MKRIKSFRMFEGARALSAIADECEDILIPLRDAGLATKIDFSDRYRHDEITIGIHAKPGDNSLIQLGEFEDTFEHLVSYLEEEGFNLGSESCYEGLDSREACPECGHDEIRNLGFDEDYNMVEYECIHCGHEDNADNFTTCHWNIGTEKELKEMLGMKIYGIDLAFNTFSSDTKRK